MRAHQAASSASSARENECGLWRWGLAGDHAVAHHRQGKRCGITAGNLRWFEGADWPSDLKRTGRHWYSSPFLLLVQHFHAGVNEWLTIRNSPREFFEGLLISRCDVRHGSWGRRDRNLVRRRCGAQAAISGHSGLCGRCGFCAAAARTKRRCYEFHPAEKDLPFYRQPFT